MRPFSTAIQTAALVAIAIGLATLPAGAQTPPAPTGAGADLVGGADNPYNDLGITASESGGLGTILGGQDLDMGAASLMDHQSPPSNSPVIPSLFGDQDNLASLRDAPNDGAASDSADAGDAAEDNGMSADEYADPMDDNADAWDDLADNAADPADAAGWRKHAKDLRAEAARARAQAAKDKARQAALLQQSSANTVGTAVSVAVNSGIRTAVNGAAHQAAHSATRVATMAVRPRVETPRFVITAGPTMYRY